METINSAKSETPRRVCPCGMRMASVKYDPHLRCSNCIGKQCAFNDRCETCHEWSDDTMNLYLRHQAKLQSKRESKRKRKLESGSGGTCETSESVSGSQHSGVSEVSSLDLGSDHVSQEDISRALINIEQAWEQRFTDFQNSISASMSNQLGSLFNNFASSFRTAPSQVPVNQSTGTRQTDPSPEEPQNGNRLEGNREEQVPREKPSLCPPISVSSINVGASCSGLGQGQGTSGDREPGSELGSEDEGSESGSRLDPNLNLSEIQLKQLQDLVIGFFPEAKDPNVVPPKPVAATEGIFAPAPTRGQPREKMTRFQRFSSLKKEVEDEALAKDNVKVKSFRHLLKPERGSYQVADRDFQESPIPNSSIPRLTSPRLVTEKMCVSVPLEDLRRLENTTHALQDTQSFSMWLLAGLLQYIKSAGFQPPDLPMFERLCSSITGAQVKNNACLNRIQAYCVLNRRRLYLSHAPPSLSEEQKLKLMNSPIFGKELFDGPTLDSIISEHQGDVSTKANQHLVTAISSWVGQGNKKRKIDESSSGMASPGTPLSEPRASTSGTSASQVRGQQFHNRGRGRGGRGGVPRARGRGVLKASGNSKKNFQS